MDSTLFPPGDITGQDYVPGQAPTAKMGGDTANSNAGSTAASNNGDEIKSQIEKQGNKVRDVKAAEASKDVIDAEVKTLLELKAKYKEVTGVDFATPAGGGRRGGGGGKKEVKKQAPAVPQKAETLAGPKKQTRLGLEAKKYSQILPLKQRTADFPKEKPPSLEEEVFKNHLVTKAVFKCLDTGTLKNLRVVSKDFNNFATDILLLRQSLWIFVCNGGVDLRTPKSLDDVFSLDQARESITNSVKLFHRLPTDSLQLFCKTLEEPDLQNFLSECGYLVKTLELQIRQGDPTSFQHLLLHQVVNLETLYMRHVPWYWHNMCNDFDLFRDNKGWINISSLKKIIFDEETGFFDTYPGVFQALVRASANLRQVKGCRGINILSFLPDDVTSATASTRNSSQSNLQITLTFDPCPEDLTIYSQILDGRSELPPCIQIQKLKVEDWLHLHHHPEIRTEAATILTKFLKMISPTLEKLVLKNGLLGFLGGNTLQFPQLKTVTKVHFIITERFDSQNFEKTILPSNCPITHAFPNIQHLKITLYTSVNGAFFDYFGNPLSLPSLKTLEFIGGSFAFLPACWVQQFSARAPNVTKANIGMLCLEDFPEACKTLWTQLVSLQELQFTVNVFRQGVEMDSVMDVAFTGFSEETCKRLRKEQFDRIQSQTKGSKMENNDTVIRAEDWKDERKSPSILDLKSLKSLRVYFCYNYTGNWNKSLPVFLSCVAGLYGFKMCDKLKGYYWFESRWDAR